MVPLGVGTRSREVPYQSEASLDMDVVWLHECALELAWREVEDKQMESDGVGDEWKEGVRGEKRKEMKKEGGEVIP